MNKVRKVPEFPEFHKDQGVFSGIFSFLLGTLLWIGLLIVFIFVAYTNWFKSHLHSLLNRFKKKRYDIPFWFTGLCTIFLFPFTIIIILVDAFLGILKD